MVQSRTTISIFLTATNQVSTAEDPPLLEATIQKIEDILSCDDGKGFVGLFNAGYNSAFSTDLKEWTLEGFNTFDKEDPWNALCVNYNCKFPINLILSPSVLDRYKNIFRLLFPLRVAHMRLNQAWHEINYYSKSADQGMFKHLVKLSVLRAKMSSFIESFLNYFYIDVLEVKWAKLHSQLESIKEYEALSLLILSFLDSLSTNMFLQYNNLMASLHSFIGLTNSLAVQTPALLEAMAGVGDDSLAGDALNDSLCSLHSQYAAIRGEVKSQLVGISLVVNSQHIGGLLRGL